MICVIQRSAVGLRLEFRWRRLLNGPAIPLRLSGSITATRLRSTKCRPCRRVLLWGEMAYAPFLSNLLLALFDLIAALLTDVFSKFGKGVHHRARAYWKGDSAKAKPTYVAPLMLGAPISLTYLNPLESMSRPTSETSAVELFALTA